MDPKRPKYPTLKFVHLGHEFFVSAVPEGADVELHIADQYGRLLLPFSLMTLGTKVPRGRDDNRRRIDAGMAELQKVIEAFDEARLLRLLEIPRAASDFDWTPTELDAASKIDWSSPAATLVHEGYNFAIGAFETKERLVVLLGDTHGPFDGPMSMPREMIMRAELKGDEPLQFGITAMITQIRTWSTSRTAAFVRNAPRLSERMRPDRGPTGPSGRN